MAHHADGKTDKAAKLQHFGSPFDSGSDDPGHDAKVSADVDNDESKMPNVDAVPARAGAGAHDEKRAKLKADAARKKVSKPKNALKNVKAFEKQQAQEVLDLAKAHEKPSN